MEQKDLTIINDALAKTLDMEMKKWNQSDSALTAAVQYNDMKLQPLIRGPDGWGYRERYTMKSESVLNILGVKIPLTIIGFSQGDATGSQKDYTIESVAPKDTPRKKEGLAEIYITLGTLYMNSQEYLGGKQWIFNPDVTSLEAITLRDGNLESYNTLGVAPSVYEDWMSDTVNQPRIPINTTGFTYRHPQYGNPHVIKFSNDLNIHGRDIMQFAAFIALKDDEIGRKLLTVPDNIPLGELTRVKTNYRFG